MVNLYVGFREAERSCKRFCRVVLQGVSVYQVLVYTLVKKRSDRNSLAIEGSNEV